jgi:signal peptidase II
MTQGNKAMNKGKGKYSLKNSSLWGILLFVGLLLIDQLTKFWADAYFSAAGAPNSVKIIPGWIELCQHYNTGIAFSGLNDAAPWVKILLIIGTAALMALFSVFYFRTDKRRSFLRLAIVFIVAGGVGNLIDRLYFKMWLPDALYGVRDMVMVDFQIFDFGICNFADFFISAGAVMLVLAIAFFDKDAFIPLGKYKALAEEAEAEEKAKAEAKEKAKAAQSENKPQPSTEEKRANHAIVWREADKDTDGAEKVENEADNAAQPTPEQKNENTDSAENNG